MDGWMHDPNQIILPARMQKHVQTTLAPHLEKIGSGVQKSGERAAGGDDVSLHGQLFVSDLNHGKLDTHPAYTQILLNIYIYTKYRCILFLKKN
jgi:hypothetical protein